MKTDKNKKNELNDEMERLENRLSFSLPGNQPVVEIKGEQKCGKVTWLVMEML